MKSSSSKVAAYRCSPSSSRSNVMSRSPPAMAHGRDCTLSTSCEWCLQRCVEYTTCSQH